MSPASRAYTKVMALRLLLLLVVAQLGWAAAHVPFFPEADVPVAVDEPAVSKAYYVHGAVGTVQTFVVAPVPRSIPLQVLVLDDAAGRAARFRAEVDCGEGATALRITDVAFYEPFSRLAHRIVAAGALGPSDVTCVLTVAQTRGEGVPYTVSIGDAERFGFADVLGLLDLRRKLTRWQEGR